MPRCCQRRKAGQTRVQTHRAVDEVEADCVRTEERCQSEGHGRRRGDGRLTSSHGLLADGSLLGEPLKTGDHVLLDLTDELQSLGDVDEKVGPGLVLRDGRGAAKCQLSREMQGQQMDVPARTPY